MVRFSLHGHPAKVTLSKRSIAEGSEELQGRDRSRVRHSFLQRTSRLRYVKRDEACYGSFDTPIRVSARI